MLTAIAIVLQAKVGQSEGLTAESQPLLRASVEFVRTLTAFTGLVPIIWGRCENEAD
jgi:hypothetical protein